jgi:hypothetical protein
MKRTLAILALVLALPAADSRAALPQQSGTVDLRTAPQGRVDGTGTTVVLSGPVTGMADMSGDGRGEVAALYTEGGKSALAIVFGAEGLAATVPPTGTGFGGFRIKSATNLAQVADAGDVNGDGRSDVIIGTGCSGSPGKAWVVFGRAGTADVDLDAATFGGFLVTGGSSTCMGRSVAGAGDVNADGLADVIVGDSTHNTNDGRAIVVLGRKVETAVDANALGTQGFQIVGPNAEDGFGGTWVAGLGDVNGDGQSDVGMSAPLVDDNVGSHLPGDIGAVFVVFGRPVPNPITVNTDTLNPSGDTSGFRVEGPHEAANLRTMAKAGDVNGDGKGDIALGTVFDDRGAGNAGSVSVLFGKADANEVNLASLGDRGYLFQSKTPNDNLGAEVSGTGTDLNGDRIADILGGAPFSDPQGRTDAGQAFALFGRNAASTTAIDVGTLGGNGIRFDGPREFIQNQQSTATVGDEHRTGIADVNGDGRADVIVGVAGGSASGGQTVPGTAMVLYGYGTPAFSCPATASLPAGVPAAAVKPTVAERTGTPSFSIAPAPPAGLSFDGATGTLSGTPTAAGSTSHTVTMNDLAGTATKPVAINIAAPPITIGVSGPPKLTKLRATSKRFRVGKRGTAITGAKRAPFGTTIKFTLSEPATVRFRITCVKPKGAKLKKACKTLAKKNTITRKVATAGPTVFNFTGRVGTKPLPIASFAMTVVATDSEKLSTPIQTIKFKVVRR